MLITYRVFKTLEKYIINYNDYLADAVFCGDKTTSNTSYNLGTVYTNEGFYQKITAYGAGERLRFPQQGNPISLNNPAKPSLKCAEGSEYNYSRYTVEKYTTNTGVTNGELKYPIATISADEAVMAGAYYGDNSVKNQEYYLYLQTTIFWTMSVNSYAGSANMFSISSSMSSSLNTNNSTNNENKTRPVINLKSDILWASGDGTVGTPYEVKLY